MQRRVIRALHLTLICFHRFCLGGSYLGIIFVLLFQDVKNPAKNLLLGDPSKPWLCSGDDMKKGKCEVTLQLPQMTTISHVDIGRYIEPYFTRNINGLAGSLITIVTIVSENPLLY